MKQRRLVLCLVAALMLPGAVVAQDTGVITGRVTDESGQPIPAAQVFLAGKRRGQVTNQDGRYLIAAVAAGEYEVRATLIGYAQASQRVIVRAGETAIVDFRLAQSAIELGAVVVSAAGQEQRKRELGNSVGTINPSTVQLASVNGLTALLQSRSPGVSVQSVSGTTGTASRIRVRGSNSIALLNEPIVIVDGVRVSTASSIIAGTGGQSPSRLDDFNPESIESIEILKGPAAAALYGTAAANGVIQITTRRGRAGPTRWSFYTEQGTLEDRTDYPASYTSQPNAGGNGPSRRCVVFDIAMGICPDIPGVRSYNPLRDPERPVFRTGHRQLFGVSLSGGGDQATYFLSLDREGEEGVLRKSEITGADPNALDRINLRVNVNARASEKLDIGLRTSYSTGEVTLPANDNHLLGIHLNGLLGSGDPAVRGGFYNVSSADQMLANFIQQETRRFTSAANFNFRPSGWLTVVGTGGMDRVSRHDAQLMPPNIITDYTTTYKDGFRSSSRIETTHLTGTINASAAFALRPALLSTTSVGAQYNREEYHDTRGGGIGIAPGTKSLSGASRQFTATEATVENATLGAFVQQQLAWRDRVFLAGAMRGDDNSAFGSNVGFVWYPSVSASWVASEETFIPRPDFMSSLRLRAAYGRSGLRPSFRDAIEFYAPVTVRIDGVETPAITLAGTGSAQLKPEVSREYEVGFDLGLFQDRLGVDVTLYDKLSKDALLRQSIAPSLGLSGSAFTNLGSVSNKGIEAQIRAHVMRRENVDWEMTLSGTLTRNRLEKLAGAGSEVTVASGPNRISHREGYPLGGYWQRPVFYEDENKDGLVQITEIEIATVPHFLGQPFPAREAAFSSRLTLFGNFTLAGLLDYKGGFKQMNFTRADRCVWEQVCEQTNVPEAATLRDQAAWIVYNLIEPGSNTALYVEDGDFVKLRELSLTVALPQQWLALTRLGASNAKITMAGRNLKTWTGYSGIDPELNQGGATNFYTQEYYTQPPVRRYTLRLDVTF